MNCESNGLQLSITWVSLHPTVLRSRLMYTQVQVNSRVPSAQMTIPHPANRPSGYGIAALMIVSCISWKIVYMHGISGK